MSREEKESIVTHTVYHCDFCEEKSDKKGMFGRGISTCEYCGRNMCEDHTSTIPNENDYWDDYPTKLCPVCSDIGKDYSEKLSDLKFDYEMAVEDIEKERRKRCKKAAQDDGF
jgi:hypothetical protein